MLPTSFALDSKVIPLPRGPACPKNGNPNGEKRPNS